MLAIPWRIWLGSISSAEQAQRLSGQGAWREVDVPHRAELAKEVEEFLGGDVEAAGVSASRSTRAGRTNLKFLTKRALEKRAS